MEFGRQLQRDLHGLRHEGPDLDKDEADHRRHANHVHGERRGADNYGQAMEGVRVHNGLSGGSYRGTFTDSSGQYTLTNLAAGSYTLGAVSASFTGAAAAGFANPITVGPSQSNLNFTGTSLGAFVTVAAPGGSS